MRGKEYFAVMDCICHNFYFSRPLRSDWAHWCWEFGERYAETFKLSIDRYDFTPYDHHPGGKNQDEIDDALREAGVVAVEEGGGMNLSGMDVGNAGERLRRCIAEVLPSTAKI